jgi:hypothetical protein
MLESPLFRDEYRLHRGHTAGDDFPYFCRIELKENNERGAAKQGPR